MSDNDTSYEATLRPADDGGQARALAERALLERAMAAEAEVARLKEELRLALRECGRAHYSETQLMGAVERMAAERDALARLEAWVRAGGGGYALRSHLTGGETVRTAYVVLFDGSAKVIACATRKAANYCDAQSGREPPALAVGTDDAPATLAACIHAALDEWEKLHKEKST